MPAFFTFPPRFWVSYSSMCAHLLTNFETNTPSKTPPLRRQTLRQGYGYPDPICYLLSETCTSYLVQNLSVRSAARRVLACARLIRDLRVSV